MLNSTKKLADKKQAPAGKPRAPAGPPKKAAPAKPKKWALSDEGKGIERKIKEIVEKDIEAQDKTPELDINLFLAKLAKESDSSLDFPDPSKDSITERKFFYKNKLKYYFRLS